MRIGVVFDRGYYEGGMELVLRYYLREKPADVEIVDCPAYAFPETDVDAYVLANLQSYAPDHILHLKRAPCLKLAMDAFNETAPALRQWVLDNALGVYNSPETRKLTRYTFAKGHADVPSPVDWERFKYRPQNGTERSGYLWLGRMWPGKGVEDAQKWAKAENVALDFYGWGPTAPADHHGKVAYEDVPALMWRYKTLVMLPDRYEPGPQTIIEAYAAGMELVVNKNCGALWWLENKPDELPRAAERFWEAVRCHAKK